MIQIRNNCFETNSSSSHSVCISMDSEIDPSIYELIKDNKLYIYPRTDGFRNGKTNKCLDKLQFLVSLRGNDVSTVQGSKRIKHLRTLLKKAVGVDSVYLGHVDEYYEILRKREKKPFNELEYISFLKKNFKLPIISFNKRYYIPCEIEEEIFESIETLRSFILSPNSWLYYPEGNSSYCSNLDEEIIKFESEKYYISDKTDSIISIEYLPGLEIDIEANIMREDGNSMDLENIIRYYDSEFRFIDHVHLNGNKLEYHNESIDGESVEIIDDKYNLIQITFKRNDYVDMPFKAVLNKIPKLESDFHKIPRFEGIPENAEECRMYKINIKSDKFLGDTIL